MLFLTLSLEKLFFFKFQTQAEDIQNLWFIITLKFIVMKLLKVKFKAKIGWKITQTNYSLYCTLFNKIRILE